MDVVWGETAGERGQLWLLCPMLFVLQVGGFMFFCVEKEKFNFANCCRILECCILHDKELKLIWPVW